MKTISGAELYIVIWISPAGLRTSSLEAYVKGVAERKANEDAEAIRGWYGPESGHHCEIVPNTAENRAEFEEANHAGS